MRLEPPPRRWEDEQEHRQKIAAWAADANPRLLEPGTAVGELRYWDGSAWIALPIGAEGSVLTVQGGIPAWV